MAEVAENIALRNTPTPRSGQLMPSMPRIARNLDEPAGWLAELAALYRGARRRQIDAGDASRLAYLCGVAAKLAKDIEELKQIDSIRRRLEQIEGQPSLSHEPNTATFQPEERLAEESL